MEEKTCILQLFEYTDDNYISIVGKSSLSRILSTFSAVVHEILALHIVE